MILQSLVRYYDRLASEGSIAPPGFKHVEIPFLIILNEAGRFRALQDTRAPSGKKLVARPFLVPAERGRSGPKGWQVANLLWDHLGYVLGEPKSEAEEHVEMARKQLAAFATQVGRLRERYPDDAEIRAVHLFLDASDFAAVRSDPLWSECKKIPGCKLTFRIDGRPGIVCDSENVKDWVAKTNASAPGDEDDEAGPGEREGVCLLTGVYGPLERLHPRTPIGANTNAKIVSFQKGMGFDSYGRSQSYNAPTGKRAAFAYTTALNKLLARGSRQKIAMGADTVVFWAERQHQLEDVFAELFGEPARGEPRQDYKSIVAMFRAPEIGATPLLDPDTRFFVLGLSPNVARISIRFWYTGSVKEMTSNIERHFEDLDVIKRPGEWRTLSLRSLLRSTAVLESDDGVPPNLAGGVVKAILAGTPYPRTLLSAAIRRCRADQSRRDSKTGRLLENVTYPRAALIKAVLARDHRFGTRFGTDCEKEVHVALDLENTNVGYRLGRLFAVLEKAQEEASPGINATIRDRFYGSASATPVAAFPHLMKLKNHHLAKLENRGRAVNLEKMVGEIVDGIREFPLHLTLADQGRFAVGYYHQRQALFAGSKKEQ
ncbi:MAG: type I-C CRISPR-associated protein Cas8c/Csd1 [Candidatus Riflebacteria bacterium]|nr:type I-C CRISPR-associated protein Cas8c/Csd1 [Candidatus Riflebacteria bacterium]